LPLDRVILSFILTLPFRRFTPASYQCQRAKTVSRKFHFSYGSFPRSFLKGVQNIDTLGVLCQIDNSMFASFCECGSPVHRHQLWSSVSNRSVRALVGHGAIGTQECGARRAEKL
jgi:hypothetical protein